jgi:ectoine hydroxylase-related dioxygenase (phytanoyl-CoA dioxygenase family)
MVSVVDSLKRASSGGRPQRDYSVHAADFARDGVALLRNALDEREMKLLEMAWEQHFGESKAFAERMYGDNKDEIYFLTDNTLEKGQRYKTLMRDTHLADIAQALFRGHDTYYFLEQMWKKTGNARRTAWHQDTSYLPFSGPGLMILWIPLDRLDARNVLEVVRGSHKSTLFNASMYDPTDVTAPLYDERDLPRLPNIEAERERWDIFSAAMDRGDVLAFHMGCLHGGAPTEKDQIRRSYTFRFFSDEAYFTPLPRKRDLGTNQFSNQRQETDDRIVMKGFDELQPGDPLCKAKHWKRIRPWSL